MPTSIYFIYLVPNLETQGKPTIPILAGLVIKNTFTYISKDKKLLISLKALTFNLYRFSVQIRLKIDPDKIILTSISMLSIR